MRPKTSDRPGLKQPARVYAPVRRPPPRRPGWLLYTVTTLAWLALAFLVAWKYFLPYRDVDVLIVNGTVVDGTGGPPRARDIAIRGGKIVALGTWQFYFTRAKLRLDAAGKVVTPGFIDVHTHVEPNLPTAGAFRAPNFLRQGVTTIITGNCGRSRTDLAGLFGGLQRNGSYLNVASLIGHNSVRQEVMGSASRRPTPAELTRMGTLIERAMQSGALGLSTGLAYNPGRFAETSELVALSEAAAKQGGLYVSHIRDEGRGGVGAVKEALEVGRRSNARTHISHFKCSGPTEWHTAAARLRLLDEARAAGQDVTIDVYPYNRSSTTTDVLLPDWALRDGRAGLRDALKSAQGLNKLRADIASFMRENGWRDLTHVTLAAGRPEWVGRTLAEVPAAAADAAGQIENLIKVSALGGAQAIYADMDEGDVDAVLKYPFCVFGSDSAVRDPDMVYKPHPRGSGTFPRIFGRYVHSAQALELAQAVRKATGQAADIFRLGGRGYIRPGGWADVVIFDPDRIKDGADYDRPFDPPLGIEYVLVNGTVALEHGNLTGNRPAGMPVRGAR